MPNRPGTGSIARYVALGDSYTIGTSVRPEERFPDQLVAALRRRRAEAPSSSANLGVNGYTSADLIRDELPAVEGLAPDFVTVLIGVNDVVQGVPLATYEANVATILDGAARAAARRPHRHGRRSRTTPSPRPARDYGDPAAKRAAIVAANEAMARSSEARSIRFVDIFDISRRARRAIGRSSPPTGCIHRARQYARWVERIRPVVEALLAELSGRIRAVSGRNHALVRRCIS